MVLRNNRNGFTSLGLGNLICACRSKNITAPRSFPFIGNACSICRRDICRQGLTYLCGSAYRYTCKRNRILNYGHAHCIRFSCVVSAFRYTNRDGRCTRPFRFDLTRSVHCYNRLISRIIPDISRSICFCYVYLSCISNSQPKAFIARDGQLGRIQNLLSRHFRIRCHARTGCSNTNIIPDVIIGQRIAARCSTFDGCPLSGTLVRCRSFPHIGVIAAFICGIARGQCRTNRIPNLRFSADTYRAYRHPAATG